MILFDWTKSILILINLQKRNILSNFFNLKNIFRKLLTYQMMSQ